MSAWTDLRAVLVDAITNTPRSLQVALGPSEIGNGCDRCLALMLAGAEQTEGPAPWLPTIGTAVHEWIESAVLRHLADTGSSRYLPEVTVTVGQLRGVNITGHCDLYDIHAGEVTDFKIVGATTLKKVKGGNPGDTYRRQIMLYAKGLIDHGFDVRTVTIAFLPRNAISLDAGHIHTEPYDEQVAVAALERADAIAGGVDALGLDAVLAAFPTHTGTEFSCTKWATDSSTATAAEVTPDAFLGV